MRRSGLIEPTPRQKERLEKQRLHLRRRAHADWKRQEKANYQTHVFGLVAALIGLWMLLVASSRYGSTLHILSFTAFGICMVFTYAASVGLHALPRGKRRYWWGGMDLAGIFFMIAGTYTPFTLVTLHGWLGWTLFVLIWAIAWLGVAMMIKDRKAFEKKAGRIYLTMGWLIIVAIKPLYDALPPAGFWLVVGGGITYTVGIIFFFWTRYLHHHAIWHLFVMAGTAMHYAAIFLYVLPDARVADFIPLPIKFP